MIYVFVCAVLCGLTWAAVLVVYGGIRESRSLLRQTRYVLDSIGDLAEHVANDIEAHLKREVPHRN